MLATGSHGRRVSFRAKPEARNKVLHRSRSVLIGLPRLVCFQLDANSPFLFPLTRAAFDGQSYGDSQVHPLLHALPNEYHEEQIAQSHRNRLAEIVLYLDHAPEASISIRILSTKASLHYSFSSDGKRLLRHST